MKVSLTLLAIAISAVIAEPPSPLSAQYGVPGLRAGSPLSSRLGASGLSRRFSAGRSISGGYSGASSSFRALASTTRMTPSSAYGVPSAYDSLSVQSRGGLSTQYGAPAGGYNYVRQGVEEDPMAEPANYEFNYAVEDAESGSDFGHEERRQDENAQGQYRVLLPDGRLQIVDYEADQEGFKPSIRYEETGLGAQVYARGPAGASGHNRGANAGGPY